MLSFITEDGTVKFKGTMDNDVRVIVLQVGNVLHKVVKYKGVIKVTPTTLSESLILIPENKLVVVDSKFTAKQMKHYVDIFINQ